MATESDTLPIGVYDSGVGGLGVLDKLVARLPGERFVYFGDTAHMPYGNKSSRELRERTGQITRWLINAQQAKVIVTACNTASALMPESVEGVPAVGPIRPACRAAAHTDARHVGVLATTNTVLSGRYEAYLKTFAPEKSVRQVACPGLAKLIETGLSGSAECRRLLPHCLRPLLDWTDLVILGCTHYPFAIDAIAELLPPETRILDPADYIGLAVKEHLEHLPVPDKSGLEIHVSGSPEQFMAAVSHLPLQNLRITADQVSRTPLS